MRTIREHLLLAATTASNCCSLVKPVIELSRCQLFISDLLTGYLPLAPSTL